MSSRRCYSLRYGQGGRAPGGRTLREARAAAARVAAMRAERGRPVYRIEIVDQSDRVVEIVEIEKIRS